MFRAKVLPFIGWLVISLWSRTVSIRFINREVPDRFKAEGRNFIYAF